MRRVGTAIVKIPNANSLIQTRFQQLNLQRTSGRNIEEEADHSPSSRSRGTPARQADDTDDRRMTKDV